MEPQSSARTFRASYDVTVIGGGANGTAALREIAGAGYSALLVEARDLGSGASGRSSRMLHCGLRYFETPHPVADALRHPRRFGRAFAMARDAMEARAELAGDPGVATRPIELAFPIWRDGPFPRWQIDIGLRLLGLSCRKGPPLERRMMNGAEAAQHPIGRHLRDRDSLTGMATFREYLFEAPERICIDNALAAERHGAEIVVGTRAELLDRATDGLWRVALHGPSGRHEIRSRVVLDMAGSWADDIGTSGPPLVRGTKGAHVIIRLPEGFADRGIATLNRLGRPFYGLPLGHDRFYFGPTETPYEGDARDVRVDRDDVDFLIGEANRILPGLKLSQRDVEQVWAGVRPLTHDPAQPMGARDRKVHDLADRGFANVLALTGGPIMTHRSAGRLLLNAVRARIAAPDGASRDARPAASHGAARHEHAFDLHGILVAREGASWRGMVTPAEAREAALRVAPSLGWDEDRIHLQVETFLAAQEHQFRVADATRQEAGTTRQTTRPTQQGDIHDIPENIGR
ncbi:FAD-dependent oxidoreductase [Palleronia sp. LCG004]|uniref:FAD-dependent oxidoreductase n=1 Tax=Palleronia sp. LCG004 TaxID=3079304 RepID=UPI00294230CF|nr:FAD-dependent oxidoreductase [Palleronia sp. LCG004]WOI56853.1 FAD-dependent oxidoreductase [Palleronia sp. LCG004]